MAPCVKNARCKFLCHSPKTLVTCIERRQHRNRLRCWKAFDPFASPLSPPGSGPQIGKFSQRCAGHVPNHTALICHTLRIARLPKCTSPAGHPCSTLLVTMVPPRDYVSVIFSFVNFCPICHFWQKFAHFIGLYWPALWDIFF